MGGSVVGVWWIFNTGLRVIFFFKKLWKERRVMMHGRVWWIFNTGLRHFFFQKPLEGEEGDDARESVLDFQHRSVRHSKKCNAKLSNGRRGVQGGAVQLYTHSLCAEKTFFQKFTI